jgi:hypothetical protein
VSITERPAAVDTRLRSGHWEGDTIHGAHHKGGVYGGMQVPDVKRLRDLEQENARLKKLVAERDLEIDAMQEVLAKNG